MIAIIKNRNEKGSRAVLYGSNPHSNGEDFSRSLVVFLEIIDDNNIKIKEIIEEIKISEKVIKIIKSFWLEAKCTINTKKVTSSSVNCSK